MDNPNDIGKVIKALLDASPEVEALAGGRIYPMVALKPDMPCIVYTKTGIAPAGVKEYPSYCRAEVTVSAIASSYQEMVELSGAVLEALANQSGTVAGKEVKRIAWVSARDVPNDDAYIQDLDFEIKIKQQQ